MKYDIAPDIAETELWRRWMRDQCRRNLFFLVYEVLGYRDLDPTFHVEQCRRLNHWPKKEDGSFFMYMFDFWPRGGYKTTIATIARCIQTHIRNPEETCLIVHGKQDTAEEIAVAIRDHWESNALLRWLFPDICWARSSEAPRWEKSAFTLRRRRSNKNPSVGVTSYESSKVGGHYTKIFPDDLVTDSNTGSTDVMKDVYEFFKTLKFLRDEITIRRGDVAWRPWFTGDIVKTNFCIASVATRWDINDSNSKCIDPKNAEFSGECSVNIQKAIRDDGTSFFPARFPITYLRQMQAQGQFLFSAQMQQDPYPEGTAVFQGKKLNRWNDDTLPSKLWYFTAVDPNGMPKDNGDEGDPGVVLTIGVSAIGNIYLMRIDRRRFMPADHMKALVQHATIFKPRRIVIESTAYQNTFEYWLRESGIASTVSLPIIQKPRGGPDQKKSRIMGIEPPWSMGRVFYNPSEPSQREFYEEAVRWTGKKSDQDDMLDALADAISEMQLPPLEGIEKQRAAAEDASTSGLTGRDVLDMLKSRKPQKRQPRYWKGANRSWRRLAL